MTKRQRDELKAGVNLIVSIIFIICGVIVGVFDGTPANFSISLAFALILFQFAFNTMVVS